VWTAIDAKAAVIGYHQEQCNLNNIDFYREFAGRIQGLKTARVSIGRDECVVDEILKEQGLTQVAATQAQKEAAVSRAEEQAVVMLYLRNINQSWHGPRCVPFLGRLENATPNARKICQQNRRDDDGDD